MTPLASCQGPGGRAAQTLEWMERTRASLLVICLETTPQSVSEPLSAKSERGSANQNQTPEPRALGCSLVLQNTPLRRASSFLAFFLPHDSEQAVQPALPQPCSPALGCRASRESKALLGPAQAHPGCQADTVPARCQEHPSCLPWKSPQPSLDSPRAPSPPFRRQGHWYAGPSEHKVL